MTLPAPGLISFRLSISTSTVGSTRVYDASSWPPMEPSCVHSSPLPLQG
nr:MAG TPA: hypothetical protein [Caudoviricetes sp.]